MGWLNDPKVRVVRREISASLRRNTYHFRNVGPVIFLCGGKESQPRDRLKRYLDRFHTKCHVFYAESVWDVIKRTDPELNLLQVEERLAKLSDMVLVIVESEGTFAELGAFAMSEPLRRKLLPVLESRFRDDPSFIRAGPVEWVDRDSIYSPAIWLNQERILESVDQIEERIARIPPDKERRVTALNASPKHLFFFVCDLVAVFGPCSETDVRDIARDVLQEEALDVGLYLGLGRATGVLESFHFDESELFLRPLDDGRLRSFHRTKKYIDIPTLRARMVGATQTSREGVRALAEASRR